MNKFTYGLFTASALCAAGFVATAMPAEARDRGQTNFSVSLGHVQFGPCLGLTRPGVPLVTLGVLDLAGDPLERHPHALRAPTHVVDPPEHLRDNIPA